MLYEQLRTDNGEYIDGPYLIKPTILKDERGYFLETWNKLTFSKLINEEVNFIQENSLYSNLGVLRGLHYQKHPMSQGKLLQVFRGSIFDVIVDLRENSKTFSKYSSVFLNSKDEYLLWIPKGFAHGFLSMENNTKVIYKVTNHWNKEYEKSIIWNDQELDISWPLKKIAIDYPILSEKDKKASSLRSVITEKHIFYK